MSMTEPTVERQRVAEIPAVAVAPAKPKAVALWIPRHVADPRPDHPECAESRRWSPPRTGLARACATTPRPTRADRPRPDGALRFRDALADGSVEVELAAGLGHDKAAFDAGLIGRCVDFLAEAG
jgi:hypothetical protein